MSSKKGYLLISAVIFLLFFSLLMSVYVILVELDTNTMVSSSRARGINDAYSFVKSKVLMKLNDVEDFSTVSENLESGVLGEFEFEAVVVSQNEKDIEVSFVVTHSASELVILRSIKVHREYSTIPYWKLDENSGDIAHDESGLYDAKLKKMSNSAWDSSGIKGGCLQFDGNNDYILVSEHSENNYFDMDPDIDFTISGWFKSSDQGSIVSKGGKSLSNRQYHIYIESNKLKANVGGNVVSINGVNDNSWHFFAVINYDDGGNRKFKLILDNGIGGKTVIGNPGSSTNGFDTLFGARHKKNNKKRTDNFKGKLDEIRIYHKALSDQEISNLYNI